MPLNIWQELTRFYNGVVHWLLYGGKHTLLLVITVFAYILAFKYIEEKFWKWIRRL